MVNFIKREWVAFFIMLFVVVMCFWQLTTNPPVWYDEGIYHQVVRNLATDHRYGLYLGAGEYTDMGFVSVGYPVFFPAAISAVLFGNGVVVLRMVAVAFLIGFVLLFYLLTRRLYGSYVATWSLALLATFSPLYGNGKTFIGEVPGLMYLMAGCLFLLPSPRSTRPHVRVVGAGLFLGLAASSKPLYLLLLPALAAAVLFHYRSYLSNRFGQIRLLLLGFGGIVALFIWFATQFGLPSDRGALLQHYRNPNAVAATGSVIVANAKRFVTEATPAHFAGLLGLALVLLIIKYKKRQPITEVEVVLIFFSLLTVAFYVRTAGWYRYLFPAQAVLFLFFPSTLQALITRFKAIEPFARYMVAAVCTLLLLVQIYPFYQERLKARTDDVVFFESLFTSIGSGERVLFYNTPTLAARFNRPEFFQHIAFSPAIAYGQKNLAGIARGEYEFVFALINDLPKIVIPTCYDQAGEQAGVRVFRLNKQKICK